MLSVLEDPTVLSGLLAVIVEVVRLLRSARSVAPPHLVVICVDREPCSGKEGK